jgi:DNA polymerase-3 subunit beta
MQLTIKTNDLKALLICAAKNDIRYYLNGVHFESTPTGYIAASTDGHRLLCINLPHDEPKPDFKGLIPRALIEAVTKCKAKVITISIDGDNVAMLGDINIAGKLAEGVFPDFRRAVPTSVTGVAGSQFNNEYLVDFDKVGKLLNGGKASVLQNDGACAMVKFDRDDVVGVCMPMRHDLPTSLTRPAWL